MALRPSTNPVVPIGFDFFVAGRLCDTKKIKSHAGVLLLGCEFRFLHGWHVGVSLSDLYIGVLAVAPLAFYMKPGTCAHACADQIAASCPVNTREVLLYSAFPQRALACAAGSGYTHGCDFHLRIPSALPCPKLRKFRVNFSLYCCTHFQIQLYPID